MGSVLRFFSQSQKVQTEGGQAVSNKTRSLINALRVLDSEIQSEDGVANAVVAEAATRLEEQQERIKRLEEALTWYESKAEDCNRHGSEGVAARDALANDLGRKAKEAKL